MERQGERVKRKKRSGRVKATPNVERQVHQRPASTAHYIWEGMRNHIVSTAISGPAGHRCSVHNNMERWGRRREAAVGGRGWARLNSLTFFFLPSAAMPISKPYTHTHSKGLRPCSGTWKFGLVPILKWPVKCSHVTFFFLFIYWLGDDVIHTNIYQVTAIRRYVLHSGLLAGCVFFFKATCCSWDFKALKIHMYKTQISWNMK